MFERAQLRADGRRRKRQLLGRAPQAAGAHHGPEVQQVLVIETTRQAHGLTPWFGKTEASRRVIQIVLSAHVGESSREIWRTATCANIPSSFPTSTSTACAACWARAARSCTPRSNRRS